MCGAESNETVLEKDWSVTSSVSLGKGPLPLKWAAELSDWQL